VRVLTTNDFVGSFFPQTTSYGRLPGAAALRDAVDDLREEADGGVWIDTGDLAQGSALGAISDGDWGFLALRELPIDAAVVGNHELDWGLDHLHRWSAELPFPLLAANLGFPATRVFGELAVIGLSLPTMADMHPGVATQAVDVAGLADALRSGGARFVVLALHDGVDAPDATARMQSLCAGLRGTVDLVLAGHTLQCFAGELAGVPFLQPWAFGSQVGVADLHDDGRVSLRLVDVGPERAWTGTGAAAQAALEAEVVGRLDSPLHSTGPDSTLARAIGEALLEEGDAVYIGPGDLWNQPARDGVHAFLPAGDITMAQVLRLTPFTGRRSAWGGQLVAAGGAQDVLTTLEGASAFPGGPPMGGTVARRGTLPIDTLVLTPFHAALADRISGRAHDWREIETTLRDGLIAAITR
jgi:2',3'-cyclic-nucleotide 2'-phosphodiesterase (5'-nucleotidase family)